MQAKETALRKMLEGQRQFAIPLYQRRYAWKDKDWQSFWTAIARQYGYLRSNGGASQKPTHFLGSLVVQPTSDQSSGLSTYSVIDGQQRLTTAMIMFVVIRDLWDSEENKERIHENFLVNKWESGDSRYKLLPGGHDRPDYQALVRGDSDDAVGAVGEAYRWFRNEVQVLGADSGGLDHDVLLRTLIGRLEVVDVTLDAGDNAHRIFQTLNSTGRSLSQVDLLRNHFFMLLPTRAEEAYTDYWQPMEEKLGSWTDLFLWSETVSRGGGREGVPRDRVYQQWQSDLADVEDDEEAVFAIVKSLHQKSKYYARIFNPELEPSPPVRSRLQRLKEWGSNVYHPLVLQAVLDLDGRPEELATALTYVESFMVRRMLVHVPTNNLNRIFTTTVGQMVGSRSYAEDLRKKLSAKGKRWPSDNEVRAAALVEPFYQAQRPAQRQFVLRRLEESLPGAEVPDWNAAVYTVEHVMPQNATDEWLSVLREANPDEDPALGHATVVDTLGNLTLTTQNSSLSDHPLQRKQQILGTSILKMNKQIQEAPTWTKASIEQRSGDLAEAAITLWPGPVEDDQSTDEATWESDVRAVLAFIPEGSWISLEDIAEFTEQPVEAVERFVVDAQPDGKEVILRVDGGVETRFPWVRTDVSGYRRHLVARGILDDNRTENASQSLRGSAEELALLQSGQA